MIFDSMEHIDNYRNFPMIYRALEKLSHITADNMPDDPVIYEENILFANPVCLTSKPPEECVYEAHKNYLDIHYILEGTEGIATAEVSALNEVKPYDSSKDIAFYTGKEDTLSYLAAGQFLICWPSDAHKVAMMWDSPAPIRKMVCKIHVDSI